VLPISTALSRYAAWLQLRHCVATAVPVLAGLLNLMARGGMTGSQALRHSVDALAKVVTVDHRLRQQLDEADAAVTHAETAAGEVRGRRQGRGQAGALCTIWVRL
jgi:hypothetical protein